MPRESVPAPALVSAVEPVTAPFRVRVVPKPTLIVPPPVPREKALASAAVAVLLRVPPASVTAPEPILVEAETARVPAEIVELHASALLLVPDRVRMPVPVLVRLPVPEITPANSVLAPSPPAVSVFAPRLTVPPEPASEPTVSLADR